MLPHIKQEMTGHLVAMMSLPQPVDVNMSAEQKEFKWYKLAAEQGNAAAQYNLGYCYQYSIGIAKDEEEAVKWYKLAAEQRDTNAQNNLGFCYRDGRGVMKNEEEAVKWLKLASDQGFVDAKYMLAQIYEYKKKKLLTEAAAQGHQRAQNDLDVHYKRKQNPTTNDVNTSKRNCVDGIGDL